MDKEKKRLNIYIPTIEAANPFKEDDNKEDGWGDELLNKDSASKTPNEGKKADPKKEKKPGDTPMLDAYGVSMNAAARDGKLDPVYGREEEMMRIAQILCRKKKNNPLLLGEPGVGKTAIVEALAQRIEERKVPISLMDKKIISLDLASLVAGSMYRGQFEERVKTLIAEMREHPEIILYIDEIHTIMGSGNPEGGLDAANILKPALARGEIRCIGATTTDEYRKSIEKDGAMDRRFQKVRISATNEIETLRILEKLRPVYEKHHRVKYTDEALMACVKLTERYVTERQFPDKAIDAMDEAGAHAFISHRSDASHIAEMEENLKKIHEAKLQAVKDLDYELATKYRDEEHSARKAIDMYIDELKNGSADASSVVVDINTIEKVISLTTGVPIESLTRDDMASLSGLFERLSKRVIGQDHVIADVSSAIQRNRVGLRDPKRPIGTFLFLGSSGVGKTHLSKQIARELFGSEDALIRVDMSEFMERHSVSRLIGAPPGYVGYNEGGELTEKVLRRPYSVILFDEIEKANPEVHNLLLQLLDDGVLTDSNGRKVNFKNTIVIMTSNVGTRQLKDFGEGIGFRDLESYDSEKGSQAVIQKALKRSFSPEFLNRIDRIVTFNALSREDIGKIVDLELAALGKRLENIQISVSYTDEAKRFIAEKGYDHQYGARPLKRAISKYVEDLITQSILDGKIASGNTYTIDIAEETPEASALKILAPSPCLCTD